MLRDKEVERIFFCRSNKKGVERARREEEEEKEKKREKTKSEALYIICAFHSYYWCGFKI